MSECHVPAPTLHELKETSSQSSVSSIYDAIYVPSRLNVIDAAYFWAGVGDLDGYIFWQYTNAAATRKKNEEQN